MVRRGTGWDKVLFSSKQDWTTNSQTTNAGFLTLFVLKRKIFDHLQAFDSIEKQTDLNTFLIASKLIWISFLSPHLTRFVAFFAACPYFCFIESFTISFAMSIVEFSSVIVAVDFFEYSL